MRFSRDIFVSCLRFLYREHFENFNFPVKLNLNIQCDKENNKTEISNNYTRQFSQSLLQKYMFVVRPRKFDQTKDRDLWL